MRDHVLTGLLTLGCATVRPCAAQVRVEISPFVGGYVPGGDFANIWGSGLDGYSSESVRQDIAPALGVSLVACAGQKLALAVGVGYSASGTVTRGTTCSAIPVPGTFTCGPMSSDTSGSVVTASARALVFLTAPAVRRPSFYLIAGLGWVGHSGGSPAGATNDFGPDLGVGLRPPASGCR